MDELTCRSCGHPVELGDLICLGCNANLTVRGAVVAADDPAPTASVPVPEVTEDPATAGPDTPCSGCGSPVPADATLCLNCMRVVGRSIAVTLVGRSWRYVVTAGATVLLGRDPTSSPAAGALASYDTVSRRHATVALDAAGTVTVTDLGSANGTYVDGERLSPGAGRRLPPGSTLRLASTVMFDVTADGTG